MIKRTYERLNNNYELHRFEAENFNALICLNLKKYGTALGGTRYLDYPSMSNAIDDVISLAEAMTSKAAISNVPFDGGKSVIVRSKEINHQETLKKFAECIEMLGGQYIGTIDSGTSPEDMTYLKQFTQFVVGDVSSEQQYGATSNATAYGLHQGLRAVYQAFFNQGLRDAHISIQGLGNVGQRLAKHLHADHAKLSISDINTQRLEQVKKELSANIIDPHTILHTHCDILAPCALGKVITEALIPNLKTKIIAGAANAQLANIGVDALLFKNGIHYVPDFVINAGGLIHLAAQFKNHNRESIHAEVGKIYNRVYDLCKEAIANKVSILTVTKS